MTAVRSGSGEGWSDSPGGTLDFRAVLGLLADFFESRSEPYAIIGGLAMAALGMPRTTLDVDIVTPATAQADLVDHLESLGFETLHRSGGYSNHLRGDTQGDRVDVVYVRGETEARLFGSLLMVEGPDGRRLPIPSPRHLLAMKLFAIRNDPGRADREIPDLRFLADRPEVDLHEVDQYLERYGLEELRGRLES